MCKDLLTAMLIVDPLKRITIPEIRQHSWFQMNLPKYLMQPARISSKHIQNADEDIALEISKVPKMAYKFAEIWCG